MRPFSTSPNRRTALLTIHKKDLSERYGVSVRTITRWLSEEPSVYDLDSLLSLIERLDMKAGL